MGDISKAQNIQNTIRSLIGSSASSLVTVSEIESDSPKDQVRKLQIQVFELSDAVAQLASEVERLGGSKQDRGPRIFP